MRATTILRSNPFLPLIPPLPSLSAAPPTDFSGREEGDVSCPIRSDAIPAMRGTNPLLEGMPPENMSYLRFDLHRP